MQQDDVQTTFAAVVEKVTKVPRAEVARDKRLRAALVHKSGSVAAARPGPGV